MPNQAPNLDPGLRRGDGNQPHLPNPHVIPAQAGIQCRRSRLGRKTPGQGCMRGVQPGFPGLIGVLAGLLLSAAASAQSALPVIEMSAGFHRIEAEVAASDQTRQVGLMNRQSMPTQRGMLFVFPQERTHCMWMRNTLLPLSVAFIDADGVIINIENMQPQTEDNHCAKVPARYALEMNLGWFSQRGIKPGTRLKGIEKAPPPR